MDTKQYEHRYSWNDFFSVAGAQAIGLIAAAGSVTVLGVQYIGAVAEHGLPVRIPYATLLGVGVGVAALYSAANLPGMYSFYWNEPKARKRIAACLVQMLVTAAVVAALGALVAAPWDTWTLTDVTILQWVGYGILAGGVLHVLVGAGALVLLMSGRDLPDVES